VYDLASLVPPRRTVAAVWTIVKNWQCAGLVVQNSLAGYAALPQIKRNLPTIKIVDVIHSVDELWDQVAVTREVDSQIDTRVAISGEIRRRLLSSGTSEERIRVIRSGVDLQHFHASRVPAGTDVRQILFVGRLDPAKRPLLLVEIAARLAAHRGA